jgi:hypothetical protein
MVQLSLAVDMGAVYAGLPVVHTGGITQQADDANSFGFIGISGIARSLP